MIYLFYFFAVVLIFLGYRSLRGGKEYLEYFKKEIRKPRSEYTPFVSVFAPCRGIDQNFQENLSAIIGQDYPNFEVIFVVDDKRDEAVVEINRLIETAGDAHGGSRKSKNSPTRRNFSSKLVVAGHARDEGQKVHNLRRAVTEADDQSKVFAFVDSDTRPDKNWLRNLVAPLKDDKIGCSTGYRWFVSKKQSVASQLASVWNASIASALGANLKNNFCWGGSMAILRKNFEKLGIREKWRGTLSDDFAMTRAMNDAKMPIYFVPGCLTASVENFGFRELLEFTNRQMKITRVYAPHLWKASFLGSGIFSLTFWSGFALLFFLTGWHFAVTATLLSTICFLGAAKSRLRLKAVKMVLIDNEYELNKSLVWQMTLWIFSTLIYFYNSISALISNVISWRGIRYRLDTVNRTVILE